MKQSNAFEALRTIKKPRVAVESNIEKRLPPTLTHLNENNTAQGARFTLVKLSHNQGFSLKGHYQVTPIQGTLSVFGFEWFQGPKKVTSASTCSLLAVIGLASSHSNKMQDAEVKRLFKQLNASSNDIVLVLEPLDELNGLQESSPLFKNILSNDANGIEMRIHTSWVDMAESLLHSNIVFIAGPKNAGKSSFGRYLVNRFLNSHSKIAYLDTDLGQPECTPPGLVSLLQLSQPLLGPSFSHSLKPYKSLFVGAPHPKYDPDYFLSCISNLIGTYKSDCAGMPLIVNTGGWVKGMGYDLLLHILKGLVPSHIVQVQPLGNLGMDLLSDVKKSSDLFQETIQLDLWTTIDEIVTTKSKFSPADLRLLSNSSYLHSTEFSWDFESLRAKIPYAVPLNHVAIKFLYDQVSPSQTLYALNGTWVALIHDSTFHPNGPLNIIPTSTPMAPNHQDTLGFGLVRCADAQFLYILSPLNFEDISKVNVIVRSSHLDFPSTLYEESGLPYTLTGHSSDIIGSKAVKSRPLARKRLQ